MNLAQLRHLIRDAARVTGVTDIVVIGSQAVLGTFGDNVALPIEATRSRQADFAVDNAIARIELTAGPGPSALADRIDALLGEHSQFDATFGYYAQGVEVTTAVLPPGWRDRLVPIVGEDDATGQPVAVGWCLEVHDLWASKAAAGRDKDYEFCAALAAADLVNEATCQGRIATFTGEYAVRARQVAARSFDRRGRRR